MLAELYWNGDNPHVAHDPAEAVRLYRRVGRTGLFARVARLGPLVWLRIPTRGLHVARDV